MSQRRLTLLAIAATVAVSLSSMPAEADADGCATGVITDFNGDGFADVVVGDPQATADTLASAGLIHVRYGESGSTGFGPTEVIRQQESGDGRPVQAGARYGSSIATADVDCDGYTDILVGAPLYNEAGHTDAGVAQLLLGGPSGAGDGGTTVYTAVQFGELVAAGDQFGYAVDLLEDVGQGGTPAPDAYALAIGVPSGTHLASPTAVPSRPAQPWTADRPTSGLIKTPSPFLGRQNRAISSVHPSPLATSTAVTSMPWSASRAKTSARPLMLELSSH